MKPADKTSEIPTKKRSELIVWGGALLAATGAALLLGTALTSVPAPGIIRPADPPESAFTLPPVAATIGGVYATEDKQVPLPPGDWVVMERAVAPVGPLNGEAGAPVVSTTLLRLRGHHVDAAILAQVNPPDAASNWGLPSGCENPDFYHTHMYYSSDHDGGCSYVTYIRQEASTPSAEDGAWRSSMQQAVDNGWEVPKQWIAAVYRVTDPADALQVRYLFDPSQSNAAESEVTADQVARLVAWSEASWRAVQHGFRGRLKPGGASGLADWTGMRVKSLSSQPAPLEGMDRSALKTSTFQMLGSLTQFTVAYVYLGSMAAASTLSVAASVASGALYYAHELAWSYVPDPAPRVRDLPGAGLEQPGPARL
jgi:uncharacterized membrane protein